jgi:hypothetical protein
MSISAGRGVSSTVGSPGVGFHVAGGDPDELQNLASALDGAEENLRAYGELIQSAAERTAPSGDDDAGYVQISGLVAAHFIDAADTARSASQAFRRWAAELHRCRREGMLAVSEAEHWLAQITTQTRRLTDADGEGQAQAERTALDHAHHELAFWHARGRQAWEDAEAAAELATSSLAPLLTTPPPRAAAPAPQPLTPPPAVVLAAKPGASRLSQLEQATAARLESLFGGRLTELEHSADDSSEYWGELDGRKVRFDTWGGPGAADCWDPRRAIASLAEHRRKANDYTVVDLTGYNESQIARIQSWVIALPPQSQARVIRIGW